MQLSSTGKLCTSSSSLHAVDNKVIDAKYRGIAEDFLDELEVGMVLKEIQIRIGRGKGTPVEEYQLCEDQGLEYT